MVSEDGVDTGRENIQTGLEGDSAWETELNSTQQRRYVGLTMG